MSVLQYILVLILLIGIVAVLMYSFDKIAYGQYDSQFNTPNQYNNPGQFDQNQFGNNQFQQGQYDQFQGGQFQQPYQQGYQQYGTPTYGPQYGMQPYQQQGYGGFGIQEIITALIAGGGATAYSRHRSNRLENDNQMVMAEILKGKQVDAELARITYEMNKEKANAINNAPNISLDNLQQDVNQFTDKTAKA